MINGGSVGLVNSELERTNVFHSGDPRNYQASGNVLVLGRSRGQMLMIMEVSMELKKISLLIQIQN